MAEAKKKTVKKKKKDTSSALPKSEERYRGSICYTVSCSREEAHGLIKDHGFWLKADSGERVTLHADQEAYKSYKGE